MLALTTTLYGTIVAQFVDKEHDKVGRQASQVCDEALLMLAEPGCYKAL